MLFCSYEFVLVFLPIVVVAVLGATALGHRALAKVALLVASLGFYAWWNPRYLPLLLLFLGFNYLVGTSLIRSYGTNNAQGKRFALVVAGVCANLLALLYFKYSDFCLALAGTLSGHYFEPLRIVLPLGISFIVFQKIAFLVDAYSGQIEELSPLDYGLFVSFFPQLIAGPIVHHREVMPQFKSERTLRFNPRYMALAASFFILGLSKKILFADSLSEFAATSFKLGDGGTLGVFDAWSGVLAYTLQVYFDFSGYSDMAIGLGLIFGIRLPFNFNSPLKAPSMIEFWSRWHMTLTRFLTAYVYNPLALRSTRRRAAAGRKVSTRGRMTGGAFVWLLAVPTLVTMFIAGAWHGAGYQFIAFGLIHGAYLVINHAWRVFAKPKRRSPGNTDRGSAGGVLLARALTLVTLLISMPFFRAPSVTSALRYLAALFGAGGWFGAASTQTFAALRELGHMGLRGSLSLLDDNKIVLLLPVLFIVSQLFPNTQQILREPLEASVGPLVKHAGETSTMDPKRASSYSWPRLGWRPSVPWAVALGLLAWVSITHLVAPTEFLYFRF